MPPPNSEDAKALTRAVLSLNKSVRDLTKALDTANKIKNKESWTVPLTQYLNGARETIGEAKVDPDEGTVDVTVFAEPGRGIAFQAFTGSSEFSIEEETSDGEV